MTANLPRLDASSAPGAFQVEHCDIPPDRTLGELRRHCAQQRRAAAGDSRPGPLRRGMRRLLGA